jgi:transposase
MRKKKVLKLGDGFISTGEAAKMLRISRSSVNRYLSRGILTGEKHPITNLRSIKKASVLALMEKHAMKWEEQIELQGKSDSGERTNAVGQGAENDTKKLSPHCG